MQKKIIDTRFLDLAGPPTDQLVNLILLNRPVHAPSFLKFHSKVNGLFLCADGGANRLFDQREHITAKPDFIIGDLDSLKAEVRQHYEAQGTIVQHSDCQDTTDLQKCLNFVKS